MTYDGQPWGWGPRESGTEGDLMGDLIIRGGTVVDGTGAPARQADVEIENGIITEIGDLRGRRARRIIGAQGHAVTPGFVDVHTHMDA